MDISETVKAIATVGPDAKHREDIGKSWFGTLVGQATVAVLLVFAYLAAIGLVFQLFGDALKQLHAQHPFLFYAAIAGPLLLVLIFSVVPMILRARREKMLFPLSVKEQEVSGGYYRLHPYEAEDREHFSRPDNAVDTALNWIEGAAEPVLYLSGASGTGKSSLIAAGLVPTLKDKGWQTVFVRGMGAPLTNFCAALRKKSELFSAAPAKTADATALLKLADEEIERVNGQPLLIVLDQFEEYLILDGGEPKAEYAAFLNEIGDGSLKHVRLLHVFREDYRGLIFKEGLPDYVVRQNGFELTPFNRRDAEQFLRDGPQELDVQGYDALFAGLDRIEEARGIYRPITLNMIGYVLGQQGATLASDPGRLIETYLTDTISQGASKDFSKPVLEAMITREGTKEARTIAEIAGQTKIEDWQISATLVDLREDGLVRPLENGLWEISHDFLARQIGLIVGKLKKPWISRNAAGALGIGAVGWVLAIAVALPAWMHSQALSKVAELRFDRKADVAQGLSFEAGASIGDQNLKDFAVAASALDVASLNLSNADGITDLAPLKGMPLTSLNLSNADGITDLTPLKGIPLTSLDLREADGITDLTPLEGMPLTSLDLRDADGITDLTPLKGMPLTSLDLSFADGITDLTPLEGMPLTSLDLTDADGITDLTPLKGMPLTSLDLTDADGITDLTPLKGMPLTSLDLSFADGITDLTPLKGMPLTSLNLSNADGITDLTPLKGMPLTSLDLSFADGITDLTPLKGMPLTSLDLFNADGITDLTPLKGMPLTSLNLREADGITDLTPLEGMPLTSLDLSFADGITDLTGLEGMPLTSLDLFNADGITDLTPLKGMPLTSLNLSNADGITDLTPLKGMPLTSLDLSFADGITDLTPLKGMPLTSLDLFNADGITDLTPLKGMPLTSLNLREADGITDLTPLKGMPLTSLDLSFADGITDLTPLKGMKDLEIIGASEELRKTME